MTLTERLKGTLDKLITLQHYGFLNPCHVRCVDEAVELIERLTRERDALIDLHVQPSEGELWDVILPNPFSTDRFYKVPDIETKAEAVAMLLKAALEADPP